MALSEPIEERRSGTIRRYRTPPMGSLPVAVARAAEKPLRVIVRNEGAGQPEGSYLPIPAPVNIFNWIAIGGSGPPLTLPMDIEQPCRLSVEFNDLYITPATQYKLTDGGADVFVVAPGQTLFAIADSADPVYISVEEIEGELVENIYLMALG